MLALFFFLILNHFKITKAFGGACNFFTNTVDACVPSISEVEVKVTQDSKVESQVNLGNAMSQKRNTKHTHTHTHIWKSL